VYKVTEVTDRTGEREKRRTRRQQTSGLKRMLLLLLLFGRSKGKGVCLRLEMSLGQGRRDLVVVVASGREGGQSDAKDEKLERPPRNGTPWARKNKRSNEEKSAAVRQDEKKRVRPWKSITR
jgi:hypothetical protein